MTNGLHVIFYTHGSCNIEYIYIQSFMGIHCYWDKCDVECWSINNNDDCNFYNSY